MKSDRYGIFSPTAGNFRRGCPAKARAIDVGVNYFDTPVQYGNGQSEKNLGRILQNLKPTNNPSAATEVPVDYPAQDYGRMFDHTKAAGVGAIGIRVLAGGALSGSDERHPIASPPPEPIGSAMNYDADLIGMATPQQFEDALAAVQKGPLPPAALERLTTLRQAFAGEPR